MPVLELPRLCAIRFWGYRRALASFFLFNFTTLGVQGPQSVGSWPISLCSARSRLLPKRSPWGPSCNLDNGISGPDVIQRRCARTNHAHSAPPPAALAALPLKMQRRPSTAVGAELGLESRKREIITALSRIRWLFVHRPGFRALPTCIEGCQHLGTVAGTANPFPRPVTLAMPGSDQ